MPAARSRLQRLASASECVSAGSTAARSGEEYLIVDGGKLAGTGAHSYSADNATSGSDEAARFKDA